MRFKIDPASAVPIYAQLVEQVKHALATRVLQPGDQLPSLRELSVQLRIGYLTVKRAYGELDALGITATEHGRGTYISALSEQLSADLRRKALKLAAQQYLNEIYHLGVTVEDGAQLLYKMDAEDKATEMENLQ